jgi:hypothetical protein
MIRIRYPSSVAPPPSLHHEPFIELTCDARILASEIEKNSEGHARAVDEHLRPAIQRRWETARPLFEIVAVETRAGCNHVCTFCPVAKTVDPRPPGEMSDLLLSSIAGQLSALSYTGRISFFGNNEPLLDTRLSAIISMFRKATPHADLRVLTNGTTIRPSIVRELFASGLSTLIINNYTDGERLIKPVQALLTHAVDFATCDIRVNMRYRDELLTTRGGTAPNRLAADVPPFGFCALPFTDLHIAYTGEVNVCCFDAYGVTSMGAVTSTPLVDIWYGTTLDSYRVRLMESTRRGLMPCEHCDFDGFRDPLAGSGGTLIRQDLTQAAAHVCE